jgi:hypothetical protein
MLDRIAKRSQQVLHGPPNAGIVVDNCNFPRHATQIASKTPSHASILGYPVAQKQLHGGLVPRDSRGCYLGQRFAAGNR